jgi:hypothetical protein
MKIRVRGFTTRTVTGGALATWPACGCSRVAVMRHVPWGSERACVYGGVGGSACGGGGRLHPALLRPKLRPPKLLKAPRQT